MRRAQNPQNTTLGKETVAVKIPKNKSNTSLISVCFNSILHMEFSSNWSVHDVLSKPQIFKSFNSA